VTGDTPIVELAKKLEDVGVAAITIHCRTAKMGHSGGADWSFAARAQARVRVPVLVNGDVRSADDAARALAETGCAGVMVGRRAIEHPWIFREIRARLDANTRAPPPTFGERIDLCILHLTESAAARGEPHGVRSARRHLTGYLKGLPGASALRQELFVTDCLEKSVEILESAKERLLKMGAWCEGNGPDNKAA
jgi:tRNA-dihydrouridine synthase